MKRTGRKAQPWKRAAVIIVQAVLALGALAFIFGDRDRRHQMEQAVRHASLSWMVAGVLCYGVVEVLGGLRWWLLLRVQGFRLSWRRATSIFLIGLFFLTFTPGLIGGDAARVLYVIQESPERKAEAVLVVAMDRLMGLISLILLAALVVSCRYHWLAMTPATSWLEYVTLLILAGAAGMLLISGLATRVPWLSMLAKHPALGEKVDEIGQALQAYRRHWPRTIQALANTLAAHIFYFLTFYIAPRGRWAPSAGVRRAPGRGAGTPFALCQSSIL